MRWAGATLLLAGLAAGCAGTVRPPGVTDLPVPSDTSALAGRGDTTAVAVAGPSSLLRPDLQPLPLPSGLTADDFDIALTYNEQVRHWLDYFQQRGATFSAWLARLPRYEPLVRRALEQAGLPRDLEYLALIESGFSTAATSSAGAAGIWQLMPATARLEGLEVSTYVDERRDPIRATDAAVQHLRSLYRELGSWYLAAAAYNCGSSRVQRSLALLGGGAQGADSLFWQIAPDLPSETQDYVPRFLAASILAKYPGRFGLATADPPALGAYDSVRVRGATDLAAIARAARVDGEVIRRLNPQFVLGVTPPDRTVSVRVPAGAGAKARARLAAMPRGERVHNLHIRTTAAETPRNLARAYGISLGALERANHLSSRTQRLRPGHRLIIPLAPGLIYRVRSGDTLWGIARRHHVSVTSLRLRNHLPRNAVIHPGQMLEVPAPES